MSDSKKKKSDGYGDDNDGGTGPSFWLILVIVSSVMVALIFAFMSANRAPPGSAIDKDKMLKTENSTGGKGNNVPENPPARNKAREPGRKASAMTTAEYKAISSNCALAEEHLKYDRPAEAKEAALKALSSKIDENDPLWGRAAAVITKVNSLLLSSDAPGQEKESYVIQKGDSLIKIAIDSNTTVDMLMKINGLNPANPVLRPGKTLKVFKGNWRVEISKKRFKLYLYDGENLFKVYNIGLGKREKPPPGPYEIDVKKKEPSWSKDGKQVPFGEKENILGTRWMSLKPAGEQDSGAKGCGIHGSWAPEEIGRENSSGFIRLSNDDINELYMIIPLKTTVIIED